jgi:uncharacterized protein YycO
METNNTNIKPADLFFTTSTSFFSAIIRARTWGKFSHVQIITNPKSEPHGKIEVISADPEGVTLRDAREEEFNNYAILTYPQMTLRERRNVLEFCVSQIGKPYDFVGLASFLFYKELQDENRWFCSELAYVAYKHAGIRLQRRVKQDFISPRDLYISPLLKPIVPQGRDYDWR